MNTDWKRVYGIQLLFTMSLIVTIECYMAIPAYPGAILLGFIKMNHIATVFLLFTVRLFFDTTRAVIKDTVKNKFLKKEKDEEEMSKGVTPA